MGRRCRASVATLAARLTLAVVVAGSGCGGGDPSGRVSSNGGGALSDSGQAAGPCQVIRDTEVEERLGIPFQGGAEPAQQNAPPSIAVVGMRFCRFTSEEPGRGIVDIGLSPEYAQETFDKFTANPANRPITPVSAVGIEAVWLEERNILVVLGQDDVVGVYLSVPDQPDLRGTAIELAALVLDRL